MNQFARFLTAFALLALVGAGCFSSSEVVLDDDMDEEIEDEMGEGEDEDEFELAEGDYTVDVENSTITWVGRKTGGAHDGTIGISEGSLSVGEEETGEVVIDMTSIVVLDIEDEDSNASLVEHLESDDFFSVEEYPTATFAITDLEEQDADENFLVMGELTMKGITDSV